MSKCFYHSADLDGHCSGAIIKFNQGHKCDMFGIDYGSPFPWDIIEENDIDEIWMVDFCLQPFSDMIKLAEKTRLIWIDHHKSAIEESQKAGINIYGTREIGKGACELVWNYCYPTLNVPKPVHWISQYDVWDHSDPKVLPFQFGSRLYETDPSSNGGLAFWHDLFDSSRMQEVFTKIIDKGETVLQYQKQTNKKTVQSLAFETTLNNLNVIACNSPHSNSQLFDSVYNPDKYDAMVTFGLLPSGQWTISLYTTKDNIDVSAVAKSYGGGGHQKASGFQCDKLPFFK